MPIAAPYCERPFEPRDEQQRYCDKDCKSASREDHRTRPLLGDDAGYIAAMVAAGVRPD
jgi:hypothetical protein